MVKNEEILMIKHFFYSDDFDILKVGFKKLSIMYLVSCSP